MFTDKRVYENVVDAIGRTPLVRLNSVVDDLTCNIYVKLEMLNPGGSIKDRIGKYMIEDAERTGRLVPGGTIVESTSGNTGVGLAMTAAIKGYDCIFVMADKQSPEKRDVLRAYGAEVVVTPTAVEPDDPRSYYRVADRLVEETPNAILANKYHNPQNPRTHYETTGPEIFDQIGDRMTHFVAGIGTGGTVSGTGKYLREKNADIQIVGADPHGSILYDLHAGKTLEETTAENYLTEGVGEDFLPSTMHLPIMDAVVQVSDAESFEMARRLVREEGIFTGGSGGTAAAGAIKYAREQGLGPESTLVVILPDSGSRYLSKVFNDNWMRENGFLERQRKVVVARDIAAAKDSDGLITIRIDAIVEDVIAILKENGISQAPVVDADDKLVGVVSEVGLLNHLLDSTHQHEAGETIADIVNREPLVISAETPLDSLMQKFNDSGVAIIVDDDQHVKGILTKIDLLDYLTA